MKQCKVLFFVFLSIFVSASEAYRILCLFPFNGRSHHIMFDALCKGLAGRGHQIDMISHFPTKSPLKNYRDLVDLNGTRQSVVNSFTVDYALNLNQGIVHSIATTFGYEICQLMGHERMQEFIKNPPKESYDLIITEYFGSACYLGFGHYLKAPVALAISSLEMPYMDEIIGNPLSSAFFPGLFTDNAVLTSFWDRLVNAVTNFVQARLFFHYTKPQTDIMRKYLGPDIPDVRELEKSVSLVLVNTHHSLHGIRPVTPALVQVGGLHIPEDKAQLTQELESWLDEAKEGVVYFTLGSLVNIETMPEKMIRDLYASFAKIAPVRVLMKCANQTLLPPGLPSNMLTLSWIPQQPVLRHRNTRVFITHGGLMGCQEALYYGIPVIGIPLFADQLRNINIFIQKGMGTLMRFEDINKESMDAALDALLNDPKYMESAKRESALFRDRPMSQMDTAVYWIEYVIRHGPNSLKSPAVDMPWWQLHLLDVYAFLIASLTLILYLFARFTGLLRKKNPRSKSSLATSKKKRN